MDKNCIDCNTGMDRIDGYLTCTNCGLVDLYTVEMVIEYQPSYGGRLYYKKKIYYQRINYFIKLLDRMTCKVNMNNKKIMEISNKLKLTKIKNIYKIKKWMKENEYNTMVKYIHIIYYNAYGEKLISISREQYKDIISKFKKFDRIYNKTNRRNQLNYNFVMHKLFKDINIPNKHIILPCTIDKLNKEYNLLPL